MSRAVDITGQTFGRLTVLERVAPLPGSHAACWLAVCECGNEIKAEGVVLRKGHRRSCGCLSKNKQTQNKSPQEASVSSERRKESSVSVATRAARWQAIDRDGFTFVVSDIHQNEVIVELDEKAWHCSECGSFPMPKGRQSGLLTCPHIVGATKRLPLEVAWEICAFINPPGRIPSPRPVDKPSKEAEEVKGAIHAAEARASRGRHDERDAEFRARIGEVTVRKATPEDLERLKAAKRKKRIEG